MAFLASYGLITGIEMSYSQDRAQYAAMYVPPAVAWLRLAGKAIYKLCMDQYQHGAVRSVAEEGCEWLWAGEVGFSVERWRFWKRRCGELADQENLDAHLRALAKEAQGNMESIEGDRA
jgi:hypothetical protein